MKKRTQKQSVVPVLHALLAAMLFGMNAPFSKILTGSLDPLYVAAFLYLGAGAGMAVLSLFGKETGRIRAEISLGKADMWNVTWMILLDIAAPILLMLGIRLTNASTAALLGNFEIVSTSIVAWMIFRESIGKRLWVAILLVTAASVTLSLEDLSQFRFSTGALLVLLSCICWGFENNCTRNLSQKDPRQIVIIKGLGSGFGALVIAWIWASPVRLSLSIFFALLLGFFAYGLSIFFYVKAQRAMGAARTSMYYAVAPFVGILLSWLMLGDPITSSFVAALFLMVIGTWLAVSESHHHKHVHETMVHVHPHVHSDGHHEHKHPVHEETQKNQHTHEQHHEYVPVDKEEASHSHVHHHKKTTHAHAHLPDVHHRHAHDDE